jgi:uncharacterized protein (TIGR02246 family)
MSGETQIRALNEEMVAAIRAKDVDAIMHHYTPDVVVFDLLEPLQYRGADAIRARLAAWLSSFPGTLEFEMREVKITAGEDVAFCHSLNRVRGINMDGAKIDMWWRATNCFRKFDGRWRVTHGHSSEPFDMKSGKALVDLKP